MPGVIPNSNSLQKPTISALPAAIDALRQACAASSSHSSAAPSRIISTGLPDLDDSLPARGLTCAGIHEWLGLDDSDRVPRHSVAGPRASRHSPSPSNWSPPLTLLSLIATAALASLDNSTHTSTTSIIWIGRAVWPYAPSLAPHALARSLFINAPRPADRLWAADLALRSRVAAAVILDASNFDLPATRRLQLAAESACANAEVGGLCLLARPPWEQSTLSAATTRWSIRRCFSPVHTRRWSVELLRCKGVRPTDHVLPQTRTWTLEHSHATCALAVVPDILDGSHPSPAQADLLRHTA